MTRAARTRGPNPSQRPAAPGTATLDRIAARQAERQAARQQRQPAPSLPEPPPLPPKMSLPPSTRDLTNQQRRDALAAIEALARAGALFGETAAHLGVSERTLLYWYVNDNEFRKALDLADEAAFAITVDELHRNARRREVVQVKEKIVKRRGQPDEVHVTKTTEQVAGDFQSQKLILQTLRPDIYRPDGQAKVNILNAQVNPMAVDDHRKDPRHLAMALLGLIREGVMAAEQNGPLEIDAEAGPLAAVEREPEPQPSPTGGAWPPTEPAYSDGIPSRREQRKAERHDGGYSFGPEDEDHAADMAADFDTDYDPRDEDHAADRDADDYDPRG